MLRPCPCRCDQHREPATIDLHRPGTWPLPGWQGCFVVRAATEGGALPETLRSLMAREREGGESFRLPPRGRARSLKKQFQARGLAAWDREGPLLYTAAGDLLFVPGLGIDAALLAATGEPQLTLSWVADDRPGDRVPSARRLKFQALLGATGARRFTSLPPWH